MQLPSTFYLFSMADVSHSTQCSSFPSQAKQKNFRSPSHFPPWGGQQPKRRINFRMQLEIDKQAFHKLDTVDDVALGDSDLFPGESEKKKREVCAVHLFQCFQFQLCMFVFTCRGIKQCKRKLSPNQVCDENTLKPSPSSETQPVTNTACAKNSNSIGCGCRT